MVVGEAVCGGSGGVVLGSERWWVSGVWEVVEVCGGWFWGVEGGGGVGVGEVVVMMRW